MTQYKVCPKCKRIIAWGFSYCPMCYAPVYKEGMYDVVELDPDGEKEEKDAKSQISG